MGLLGKTTIGPAMARSEMTKSTVSFTSVEIVNATTTPDETVLEDIEEGEGEEAGVGGHEIFTFKAHGLFQNIHGLGATVHAMETQVLYDGDQFGKVLIPATEVSSGDDNPFDVDSTFHITNDTAWIRVGRALANSSLLNWSVAGMASVTAHILGFPMTFSDIPFAKQVVVKGFDGLRTVNVTTFRMNESTPEAVILNVDVLVWNPSYTAISPIGELYFNMSFKGIQVGWLRSTGSVDMLRGWSPMSLTGQFHPHQDKATNAVVNELMSNYLQGIPTTVTCTTLNSTISVFSDVFKGIQLSAEFSQGPQRLLNSMSIDSLFMTPLNETDTSLFLNTTVGIQNPLGTHSWINVKKTNLVVDAYNARDGSHVGTIVTGGATVENGWEPVIHVNTSADLKINPTGWDSFMDELLNSDSVTMHLEGKAWAIADVEALHNQTLNVEAPVNVSVTTKGMGGLKRVEILNFTCGGNESVSTISAWTNLFNPSPASVSMEALTVDIAYKGAHSATITASDLILVPGANVINMVGVMDPSQDDLGIIAEFFSSYLQGKDSPITVTGKEAKGPKWLSRAVRHINTTSTFTGYTHTAELLGDLQIGALGVTLDEEGNPYFSGQVNATMQLPPTLRQPMSIPCSSMSFNMSDEQGNVMGGLDLGCTQSRSVYYPEPCTDEHCGGVLMLSFEPTKMEVISWEHLSGFLGQALRTDTVNATLSGIAGPMIMVSFGSLKLGGIPFRGGVSIKGMDAFKKGVQVGKLDILAGTPGKLTLATTARIFNPSPVEAALGPVEFDLQVNGTYVVGRIAIANFSLHKEDWITIAATAYYIDTDPLLPGRTFLSDYLCQRNQTIALINAKATGTNAKLLQPSLDGFVTSTLFPGRVDKLMTSAAMQWTNEVWKLLSNIPVVLTVNNPFSTAVSIVGAAETITYTDSSGSEPMGLYTHCDKGKADCPDDLADHPITLEPLKTGYTPSHNVKTAGITLNMLTALEKLVCGGNVLKCKPQPIPITIGGTMDIKVQTFSATVNVTEFFPVHFVGLPVSNGSALRDDSDSWQEEAERFLRAL